MLPGARDQRQAGIESVLEALKKARVGNLAAPDRLVLVQSTQANQGRSYLGMTRGGLEMAAEQERRDGKALFISPSFLADILRCRLWPQLPPVIEVLPSQRTFRMHSFGFSYEVQVEWAQMTSQRRAMLTGDEVFQMRKV